MRYLREVLVSIIFLLSATFAFSADNNAALRQYIKGEQTMSKIDSLIKLYPDDFRFKYEKCIVYLKAGDNFAAKKILDSLFLSGNRDENLLHLLINVNMQVKYVDQADFVIDTAMFYHPNSPKILLEKGYRYLANFKHKEAADLFETAIYYNPAYIEPYYPLIEFNKNIGTPLFSILYGEIYISNSQKDSLVTLASKKLYSIFENELSPNQDSVQITARLYSYQPGVIDTTNFDFEIASANLMRHTFNFVKKKHKKVSFDYITDFFTEFSKAWNKSIYSKKYKHPVYILHDVLIKNNLLKHYVAMVFSQGDISSFTTFITNNQDDFHSLIRLLEANPMQLKKGYSISRQFPD